jgi:hypothetical protein
MQTNLLAIHPCIYALYHISTSCRSFVRKLFWVQSGANPYPASSIFRNSGSTFDTTDDDPVEEKEHVLPFLLQFEERFDLCSYVRYAASVQTSNICDGVS